MPAHPTCACGALKANGRCSAVPSCNDFRKPHQTQQATQMAARRREKEATAHLRLGPR